MGVVISILVAVVLIALLWRYKSKKCRCTALTNIKNDYLGKSPDDIVEHLEQDEIVIKEEVLEDKRYIVVASNTLRTMKIYEFEQQACTSFFVQTMEKNHCLPKEFDYKKEFKLIENDNFEQGIDWNKVEKKSNPVFFNNGLVVEVAPNRFAQIHRCLNHKECKKTKGLHVYFVSSSVEKIDQMYNFIKEDTLHVLQHFNRDKMSFKVI